MRASSPERPRPRAPRTLLLGVAFLIAPVAILVFEIRDEHRGQAGVALIAVAAVLVGLRWLRRAELDRSRAEEALRASEERHRSLVEHASDLIVVLDERAVLTYVAPSSERLFGVRPEELLGTSAIDLVHPDDAPLVRSTFAAGVGHPGVTGGLEVRVRDATGSWRWVEVHYHNRLSDPTVGGIVLSVRDITERFAVQAAFREQEAQYHSLFSGNRAVMLLLDPVSEEIVDANPAALDFYGYPLDRLVKEGTAVLRADPPDVVLEEMRLANTQERPFLRLRHRLADGEIRHVEIYTGSIAIGGRALVYEIVHDVTERQLAQDALSSAEARYRTLVEQLPVATYLFRFDPEDPSLTAAVYVGPQIEEMLGVTPKDWVKGAGLWASMVHPEDLARVDAEGVAARAACAPIEAEYRMVRPDGRVVWIHDSSRPLVDADGHVSVWQGAYQDVTEKHLAEDALRTAELRYRTLVEQLPAITFVDRIGVADPDDAEPEYISPQIEDVLGYTPEEFLATDEGWAKAVHPDDLEEVERLGQQAMESGGSLTAAYRMIRKDGRVVWIEERSAVARDEQGRPAMWQGIMQDVTDKKVAELALHASERRFRAVFDDAAIGIARLSLDGHVLEANDAIAELLGVGRADLLGLHLGTFLAEPGPGDIPEEFARLAGGGIDHYEVDRQYRRRGGDRIWCHVTVSLVRNEEGQPDFAIVMLDDISVRKAAEDALAQRAMHDPLTDLPNRELLLDRMSIALARLDRGGPGVAVMFLDLDGFKRVNDEFGHDVGDRVLIEVAHRFSGAVRPADTVARYGGDEFVVLCQDVWSAPDAVAAAERLCRCLDDPISVADGGNIRIGVSVGVTLALDMARGCEHLIRDADTAMYRAKQHRRGGVAISGDEDVVVVDVSG